MSTSVSASVPERASYTVERPSVYLHTRPDIASEVCDEVLFGTRLEPNAPDAPSEQDASDPSDSSDSSDRTSWSRVKTDYGYCGYIQNKYLSAETEPDAGETFPFWVTAPFCDVLADSVYKYRPLFTLPRASMVKARRDSVGGDRFFPIVCMGRRFFVPSCAIRPTDERATKNPDRLRRRICDDALAYLGTPYRWGGRTPCGIDCSGLCFNAYALNGLVLWRDAFADRRYVHEIGEKELLPGDLIYFKGHMALYIGDGEYVHASASVGCVTVNSLRKGSVIWREDLAGKIVCYARCNLL